MLPAPLTTFRAGDVVRLCYLGSDERTSSRLREVGVREGCCCNLISNDGKCVLGVGAARVALCHTVASGLLAEPGS
jgi:hypothetical protein